ncbi:MAG: HAMP domain-containing protein [Bradyrhizobiaceae bacterium]|nr:HAMP domain-containing protein [Bradyrhizobiaceae bacterium]
MTCAVILLGFIYWRTAVYIISENDVLLVEQLRVFADYTAQQRLQEIDDRLRKDPRRVKIAGLFGADSHRIAGNVERLPSNLVPDVVTDASVARITSRGREMQEVRLIARPLPSGEIIIIGRSIDEIARVAEIIRQALIPTLLLAFVLAVAIGILLSLRAHRRLSEVSQKIQRIAAGELRERLPTQWQDDPFDQLAAGVNRMLGDIEMLIEEVAGVSQNIAHDLRTPLARARLRLERGSAHAATHDELRAVADRAISDLDQSLATITALLRIAEIEHRRRLDGFGCVGLAALLRDVGDLYDPIAEDKQIALRVEAANEMIVRGDRDLLFEAVANLVNNAIKFTPVGGRVELALLRRDNETIIRVKDSGPGISEGEREALTRRFYRSDKNRNTEGLGLGLSLVAAIVKLHDFRFAIVAGPGCAAEIVCPHLH